MISLRETARRHDVSPGGLSKAVHAERPIDGMGLNKFAVLEHGEIAGFDFPGWYTFPHQESDGGSDAALTTPEELCDKFASVSRGQVEHAIREKRKIDGQDVASWAEFDEQGCLKGLNVPDSASFTDGYFDKTKKPEPEAEINDSAKTREQSRSSKGGAALALGGALGLSWLLNS